MTYLESPQREVPEWFIGSHNGSTTDGLALEYYATNVRIVPSLHMVTVAEWFRRRIVVPVYVGSNPTSHPLPP